MIRNYFIATTLIAIALVLTGCSSFAPVYGGSQGAASNLSFAYAEPRSRLEQVIYQRLALSFPHNESAPSLTVFVKGGNQPRAMTAAVNPITNLQVDVQVTISRDGAVISQFSRVASAGYQTSRLITTRADDISNAQERASEAAAESIRLGILARASSLK